MARVGSGVREPLAYFLTWTCYGTRLHGDARGSVKKGEPPERILRNEIFERANRARLKAPAFVLGPDARRIVETRIRGTCGHRGWALHTLHVGATHVHVILRAKENPEAVMRKLKAWATRGLREAGLVALAHPVWTKHGSTRYLWTHAMVNEKLDYVDRFQRGELAARRSE